MTFIYALVLVLFLTGVPLFAGIRLGIEIGRDERMRDKLPKP